MQRKPIRSQKIGPKGLSHIDNSARNKNILLNIIREYGPISRKEISKISGLSIATTKRLIEELIIEKLVIEQGLANSTRGRKPSSLTLNPEYGYAFGINISPHIVEFVILNFLGAVETNYTIDLSISDKEHIISILKSKIDEILSQYKIKNRNALFGIGIGISGLVDAKKGVVYYCPNIPNWENVRLASILSDQFNYDIIVDDSVRCMTLAEKRYGKGKNLNNYLYIYIGDGVGAGIYLDGRLYRGRHGIAGEFGHITIKQDGPICNCGNIGCLEASVSEQHIIDEVKNRLSSNVYSSLNNRLVHNNGVIDLYVINEEVKNGDKLANIVLNNVIEDIGTGIADLINIFDPGVVILGGEVIDAFNELLLEGVKKVVKLKALHTISSRTEITHGEVNQFSAAKGAATLMIERFLQNSIINI